MFSEGFPSETEGWGGGSVFEGWLVLRDNQLHLKRTLGRIDFMLESEAWFVRIEAACVTVQE
jgi:hypothetical protein